MLQTILLLGTIVIPLVLISSLLIAALARRPIYISREKIDFPLDAKDSSASQKRGKCSDETDKLDVDSEPAIPLGAGSDANVVISETLEFSSEN